MIKCRKSVSRTELRMLYSCSWGITSDYSDLDTEKLKCLGSDRALLFTVPSERHVVTELINLITEKRIKCA